MKGLFWTPFLATGFFSLGSGQTNSPKCANGESCSILLGSSIVAKTQCLDPSGTVCSTDTLIARAAAYSRAQGGVSFAYDSNKYIYALSITVSEISALMNVNVNVRSSTCSGVGVRTFVAFDNTCSPDSSSSTTSSSKAATTTATKTALCSTRQECTDLLGDYVITKIPCTSYAGSRCSPERYASLASELSQVNNGISSGSGPDGQLFALSATPAQIAERLGSILTTSSATCTATKIQGLYFFALSCFTRTITTTASTTATTPVSTAKPCGGDLSTCTTQLQDGGYIIASIPCKTASGDACAASEFGKQAALFAKQQDAAAYAFTATGQLYALKFPANFVAIYLTASQYLHSASSTCNSLGLKPLYVFDITCGNRYFPTTTTSASPATSSATVPCGGDLTNCVPLLLQGKYIDAEMQCQTNTGDECAASDYGIKGAEFAASLGVPAFGYTTSGRLYAINIPSMQIASVLSANGRIKNKGSACSGVNLSPLGILDIGCVSTSSTSATVSESTTSLTAPCQITIGTTVTIKSQRAAPTTTD